MINKDKLIQNYIGLDTSLSSTFMYILLKDGTEHYFNYKSNNKLSKWHKTLSFIQYRDYEVLDLGSYSDNEIGKIIKYDQITDQIISDILALCKPEETTIITEGYSFSSSSGMIIHLVTYATILRHKLLRLNFKDFIIKTPSTLKSETCELVYGLTFNTKGKKMPSRNHIGIAGGSFKKHEMIDSLFYSKIETKLSDMLLIHKEEILSKAAIPKPIDDAVDSMFLVFTSIKYD
jgi:hypothetical protein